MLLVSSLNFFKTIYKLPFKPCRNFTTPSFNCAMYSQVRLTELFFPNIVHSRLTTNYVAYQSRE